MKKYLSLILQLAILGGLLSACSDGPAKEDTAVVVQNTDAQPVQPGEGTEPAKVPEENSVENTDVKAVREVVNVTVDLGRSFIKNLKTNDSIKMSHREKMFAYQIGLPIRHERDLFDEYKKLYDVESVYILKKSRKDHYIIKYEGKSEEELRNGLEEFKSQLPAEIAGGVKIINLAGLCSRREKLKLGEKITKRKEDMELPCLICD